MRRNKLYIIGNGFDKGHNLGTDYWNFRQFLEKEHEDFLRAFEETHGIVGWDGNKNSRSLLWKDLESSIPQIDYDNIIDYFSNIDLGVEFQDDGVRDGLIDTYWKVYSHIDLLNQYIDEWAKSIDLSTQRKIKKLSKNDYYITFNYTKTLEKVYKIPETNIFHIHGIAGDKWNPPVLGHGNRELIVKMNQLIDEAKESFWERKESICAVVKKYLENSIKDVKYYSQLLKNIPYATIGEVIVIGHSMSDVDLYYFEKIKQQLAANCKWNIYYLDEEALNNLSKQVNKLNINNKNIFYLESKRILPSI